MAGVHIRNRNGRLYLESCYCGRQSRKSLGLALTGDRALDRDLWRLAKVAAAKRQMQIACARWGIANLPEGDKALYKLMEENIKKSGNRSLAGALRWLKRYKGGSARLSEITSQWVEAFQRWLMEETGLSQGSASLYSGCVRRQLALAAKEGLVAYNPAQFVKNIPMPQSKKQPLSCVQLKVLCLIPIGGRLGAEVKRAFLFSCFTGLRVSDLRELRWNMLSERADGSVWLLKRQKKTGSFVEIPLHKCAICLVGFLRGPRMEAADCQKSVESGDCKQNHNCGEPVFPLLNSTKTNTDQYLRKWGLKAGISGVSWHTARHTMATLALENGAELRAVSALLGHSDISSTMRYAKATDKLKNATINSLPHL